MSETALTALAQGDALAVGGHGAHRERSLRANFSWTFVGNVIYSGCQWGMLIVLAKLGSPEIVGHFALGLALTAPIILLTNLQLRGVQATDARRAYQFGDYYALRLLGVALALVVIAGIVAISRYDRTTALVVLIIGLAKAFEAVSDIFYGLLQQYERMDRIAISMIVKGVLSLVALSGILFLTGRLLWSVVGLAVVWAAVLVCYDVPSGLLILRDSPERSFAVRADASAHPLRPRWEPATLGKLTWLALPLGAVMLLNSLYTNIPRYFIAHDLGTRALGIFAALSYLLIAGTTVVNALGQSVTPRLSRYWAAGDRTAFRALFAKLLAIAVGLGAAGLVVTVIAGRTILALLYRPEYAVHYDVFFWIVVAVGLEYIASLLGYGMTAVWYFRGQVPLYLAVAASMALACAVLIPRFGLLGAAYAIMTAITVHLMCAIGLFTHALSRGTGA